MNNNNCEKIEINNKDYKGIEKISPLSIPRFTILMGENDTGKTYFLQGIYSTLQNVFGEVKEITHDRLTSLFCSDIPNKDNKFYILNHADAFLHPKSIVESTEKLIETNKSFFIETHSDFVIKRLAICIMKGKLSANDFQLLYFNKNNETYEVYRLFLNVDGNLEGDIPENYRSFFIKETDHFLGF